MTPKISLYLVSSMLLTVGLADVALSQPSSASPQKPSVSSSPQKSKTPEEQELQKIYQEGRNLFRKGQVEASLKKFEEGLVKAEAQKNENMRGMFLNALGNVNVALARYEQSFKYNLRAYDYFNKIQNQRDMSAALNNLGSICMFQGRIEEAVPYIERAVELIQKQGSPRAIAETVHNMGVIYQKAGKFDLALKTLERANAMNIEQGDQFNTATTLLQVGKLYHDSGRFDRALDYMLRALDIAEKNKIDEANYTRLLNDILKSLGDLYFTLGRLDDSKDCLTRAYNLIKNTANPALKSDLLNSLGCLYFRMGDVPKARYHFEESHSVLQQFQADFPDDLYMQNIGVCLKAEGRAEEAKKWYEKALKNIVTTAPTALVAIYSQSASYYMEKGDFPKALDLYKKTQPLAVTMKSDEVFTHLYHDMGTCYAGMNDFDRAASFFSQSIQYYERIGQQVKANTLASISLTFGNIYYNYATVLVHKGEFGKALEILERGRAQALARQAEENRTRMDRHLTVEDAKELQRHNEAVARAGNSVREITARPVPRDREALRQYTENLRTVQVQYREAERQLIFFRDRLFSQQKNGRFGRLLGAAPPTIAQLYALSARNPNTLYLEYSLQPDRISLFGLYRGKLFLSRTPCESMQLEKEIAEWRQSLLLTAEAGRPGNIPYSKKEVTLARSLYQKLLAPITQWKAVRGYTHLVVVPDSTLLEAPYAALVDNKGHRLIEKTSVSTAFSLGSLLWKEEKKRKEKYSYSLLCVADTTGGLSSAAKLSPQQLASRGGYAKLPAAREESKALQNLFPENVSFTGDEGRETVVKEAMRSNSLLHFAVHGEANGRNGLASRLVLAPEPEGSNEDGFLEAREIAEMSLGAQLAVLSACQTARGQRLGGEGLVGLAWAFRAAGVPAIVASQWSVDDTATKALMIAFYRNLKAGKNKDEALQQAMLAVRKEKSAPYYWAAFQIVGDTSPIARSAQ